MKIELIDTVYICSSYVCTIEYGDDSGLDDNESKMIAAFCKEYADCLFVWGESSEFERDYISGLMADCLECKIYQQKAA